MSDIQMLDDLANEVSGLRSDLREHVRVLAAAILTGFDYLDYAIRNAQPRGRGTVAESAVRFGVEATDALISAASGSTVPGHTDAEVIAEQRATIREQQRQIGDQAEINLAQELDITDLKAQLAEVEAERDQYWAQLNDEQRNSPGGS